MTKQQAQELLSKASRGETLTREEQTKLIIAIKVISRIEAV